MYGIYTYIWLFFMLNVGKYIPYMDPMGYITSTKHQTHGLKLEKTLQPSNISTTRKKHTPILPIFIDSHFRCSRNPHKNHPSKKKATKWYPMVSTVGVPTEFGCKFQDLKRQPIEAGSPSVKGPKSFHRIPKVP